MSDEQRYTTDEVRTAFVEGACYAHLRNGMPGGLQVAEFEREASLAYPRPAPKTRMVWDLGVLRTREHADVRTLSSATDYAVLYDQAFG